MHRLATVLAALLLLATGCTDYMSQSLPAPETDEQALAFAVDRFAVDLYAAADKGEGNAVISPYSVSAALGMAYPGARGSTATQMEDVLHLSLAQDVAPQTYGGLTGRMVDRNQLDPALLQPDEELQLDLRIEDSAWLQQGTPWQDDYLAALEDFGAERHDVDYAHAGDVRDEINDWVGDRTEGLIPELIPEGVLDEWVRAVLVNAIYFWGSWAEPFEVEDTEERTFHLQGGGSVEVPVMVDERDVGFVRGSNFKAIALPYAHSSLGLLVVLPDSGQFTAVERDLSAGGLYHVAHDLESHLTEVWLPRFSIDQQYLLAETLLEMGMTDAFDPGRADFSGMDGGVERLFLSDVIHQAVIDLDERGTEAAAATAVIAKAGSAEMPEQPKTFHATRPFLFAIYDHETDVVLFLGRVMDPSS